MSCLNHLTYNCDNCDFIYLCCQFYYYIFLISLNNENKVLLYVNRVTFFEYNIFKQLDGSISVKGIHCSHWVLVLQNSSLTSLSQVKYTQSILIVYRKCRLCGSGNQIQRYCYPHYSRWQLLYIKFL